MRAQRSLLVGSLRLTFARRKCADRAKTLAGTHARTHVAQRATQPPPATQSFAARRAPVRRSRTMQKWAGSAFVYSTEIRPISARKFCHRRRRRQLPRINGGEQTSVERDDTIMRKLASHTYLSVFCVLVCARLCSNVKHVVYTRSLCADDDEVESVLPAQDLH